VSNYVTQEHAPHEVDTWSLEYLGPGFHVQLRIVRRHRQARVDGWVSPAQPMNFVTDERGRPPATPPFWI
jgi:hypothetical protein